MPDSERYAAHPRARRRATSRVVATALSQSASPPRFGAAGRFDPAGGRVRSNSSSSRPSTARISGRGCPLDSASGGSLAANNATSSRRTVSRSRIASAPARRRISSHASRFQKSPSPSTVQRQPTRAQRRDRVERRAPAAPARNRPAGRASSSRRRAGRAARAAAGPGSGDAFANRACGIRQNAARPWAARTSPPP